MNDYIFANPSVENHLIFNNPFIQSWKDGYWKECNGCVDLGCHSNSNFTNNCSKCVRCPFSSCGTREDQYSVLPRKEN